jgi:hypothetical protein
LYTSVTEVKSAPRVPITSQERRMTSIAMHNHWTAPTMLSLWTEPKPKGARLVRGLSHGVTFIDRVVLLLSPLVVTVGALFAAAAWPAPAHADAVTHPVTDVRTAAATGDALHTPGF